MFWVSVAIKYVSACALGVAEREKPANNLVRLFDACQLQGTDRCITREIVSPATKRLTPGRIADSCTCKNRQQYRHSHVVERQARKRQRRDIGRHDEFGSAVNCSWGPLSSYNATAMACLTLRDPDRPMEPRHLPWQQAFLPSFAEEHNCLR